MAVWRMRFACRITKARDMHSHNFLLFHGCGGYANALSYSVILHYLPSYIFQTLVIYSSLSRYEFVVLRSVLRNHRCCIRRGPDEERILDIVPWRDGARNSG